MFKINDDYKPRKILVNIFFIGLLISFVLIIVLLLLKDKTNNLINWIIVILIIAFVSFFLIFSIIEINLKNIIDKKIIYFLNEKEFDKGLNYLNELKINKIFFDVFERIYYYEGLFYLHLDNILKAKESFLNINNNFKMVEDNVLINSFFFLTLIYKDQNDDLNVINKEFNKYVKDIKNNKYSIKKLKDTINVTESILENKEEDNKEYLLKLENIPVIKRILEK